MFSKLNSLGKVSPCREVVLLKIIEEVSCKNLRYERSRHASDR
ncbi:hypothetical protein V6Z11_D02G008800 [Gossypium hirsutum]